MPLTAKAPIPPRVCAPNPGAKWVDGLNAHNDYQNRRPLKGALSNGATSVEVDLAFDPSGRLMVTHEVIGDLEGREFRATYVKPFIDRAKKNGGQIYPGQNGKFQLFVEVKSKDGVKQREEARRSLREDRQGGEGPSRQRGGRSSGESHRGSSRPEPGGESAAAHHVLAGVHGVHVDRRAGL
ncbi:hypothetical protein AB0C21_27915 [Spirillospora sp. NPDC049024]